MSGSSQGLFVSALRFGGKRREDQPLETGVGEGDPCSLIVKTNFKNQNDRYESITMRKGYLEFGPSLEYLQHSFFTNVNCNLNKPRMQDAIPSRQSSLWMCLSQLSATNWTLLWSYRLVVLLRVYTVYTCVRQTEPVLCVQIITSPHI